MTDIIGGFFLLMGVGILWRFVPNVPSADSVRKSLGAVVINFFLPGLTFTVLYTAPITSELWKIPIVSGLSCIAATLVALAVYRLPFFRRILPKPSLGTLLLAAGWCNATYLGIPVVTAMFGKEMQRVPLLFDLLAMTPLLWTLGVFIADNCSQNTRHASLSSIITGGIKTIFSLPPFWAAALGLLANAASVPMPQFFLGACDAVGSAVPPMMIFSIGLALKPPRMTHFGWMLPALLLKLFFAPAVAWSAGNALGMEGASFHATVVEAAMPTMVLTMVVADRFGLDTELLAQCIVVSTITSLFTIGIFAGI